MNKYRKISIILIIAICIMSFSAPIGYAAGEPQDADAGEYIKSPRDTNTGGYINGSREAETLNKLGLFLGTENGFELERAATRAETAVMTVRLLGMEGTVKKFIYTNPFSDVPDWAGRHVGYLYDNNIAKGVSDELFGSDELATPQQFATFVLRALGYDDAAGDFSWDKSLEKMAELGIITDGQRADLTANPAILRGGAAAISYASLFANLKNGSKTLLEKLYITDKAITAEQLQAAAATDDRTAMFAGVYGLSRARGGDGGSDNGDGGSDNGNGGSGGGSGGGVGEALTSEEIFATASGAVFKVETKAMSDMDFGSGSGFFITSDGIAVTNLHVIMNMSSASITTANGKVYPIEGVLALHYNADIAIIKIKGSGFPYLEVGDPSALRVAQRIYCIGSPYGLDNTISDGLVSSLSRLVDGYSYIQISAAIAPGSSGGALLNEYGQVVGVTTAGFSQGQVNMATPISELATADHFKTMRSLQYLLAHSHFGCLPIGKTYNETEPNDKSPKQTMANDTIMHGSITGAGDVDCYTLDVRKKAEILISLTSDEIHNSGLKFEVADPSGNVILKSRCYEGDVFSLATGLGAKAGKYTIRIFVDKGNGSGGGSKSGSGGKAGGSKAGGSGVDWSHVDYELYWIYHVSYADSEEESMFLEFEPNDTPEYANYLPDAYTYISIIATKNDIDYYTFTLADDSTYQAIIFILVESSALGAVVLDADGGEVGAFEYDESLALFECDLPAGTYYIKVWAKDKSIKWDHEPYLLRGWYVD